MTNRDRQLHDLKNELCILVGFSEMLLTDAAADDPRRADLNEIHRAAGAALEVFSSLYETSAEETHVHWNQEPHSA